MTPTVATLLLTDVVDSTKLVESLGDARAAAVWAAHDALARDLLPAHGGREIDKTDGFLFLFDRPVDAVAYALAYHRALGQLDPPLRARAGIHLGEVVLRENPAEHVARGAKPLEVEGLAKPLAARVMSVARGGQTLLTRGAYDLARRAATGGELPAGLRWMSHGDYLLKGVDEAQALFEVGEPGVAPLLPPEGSDKVRRADEARRRHNLGPEASPLVGRAEDLATLQALLGESRLVSLLGPGGIGKTRLSQELVRQQADALPGGAWFVDLCEARSLDGVLAAIGRALEVPLSQADPLVQLGHAVAGRGPCLLVLDNLEQVVEPGAEVVSALLAAAPAARLVVTTREALRLSEEQVLPLEPLPLGGAAIELFVARARKADPRFALTDANRASVAELVALLDGLPLAIELAAARVRAMPPAKLVQRMSQRLDLLEGRARDRSDRQATMRGAIEWSWSLLQPWEQAALAQASVFEGGFTLEAAEEVLDLSQWPDAPWPSDVIEALVDKSLLRTWNPAATAARFSIDEPYFGMYGTIRDYAAEKLGADALGAARDRHAEHYAAQTGGRADWMEVRSEHVLLQALTEDLDNLVAATRHAIRSDQVDLAIRAVSGVFFALHNTGPLRTALQELEPLLARQDLDIGQRARVLQLAVTMGRDATGQRLDMVEEAIALARQSGEPALIARTLISKATEHFRQGQGPQAFTAADEALAIVRSQPGLPRGNILGSRALIVGRFRPPAEALEAFLEAIEASEAADCPRDAALMRANMGAVLDNLGRLEEGLQVRRDAIAVLRELGARVWVGIELGNLAAALHHLGQREEARALYEEALREAQETGNRYAEAYWTVNLGEMRMEDGDLAGAAEQLQRGIAIAESHGDRYLALGASVYLSETRARQGMLDQARQISDETIAGMEQAGLADALVQALAVRGRIEVLAGQLDAARAVLARAEAAVVDFAPGSPPRAFIDKLCAALAEAEGELHAGR